MPRGWLLALLVIGPAANIQLLPLRTPDISIPHLTGYGPRLIFNDIPHIRPRPRKKYNQRQVFRCEFDARAQARLKASGLGSALRD
ncbi:hypothetical protein PM082_014200 [Marasmius tenuissimus]|nr:hypothetical protein PM082_014200 [Marasmius tenuissimus]